MTAVFLDLDGTLVDSRPGIVAALAHAFNSVGRGDLADSDLSWMLGPPLVDSFTKLGFDDPDVLLQAYRSHYIPIGMFEAEVYPGVAEVLDQLNEVGCRLYLATAKPHAYARKVTAHFGLAPKLSQEFGPELDGTNNWKGDLLRMALAETGEDPARSVMVGDRHHDMAAAVDVGMSAIAVTWGYGQPDEWETANAQIDTPDALPQAIAALNL